MTERPRPARSSYRWLARHHAALFGGLPARTRLLRAPPAHQRETGRFLADPTSFAVIDTYGIEPIRPWRPGHRRSVGLKPCRLINRRGEGVARDRATADAADRRFAPVAAPFAELPIPRADPGFAAADRPANLRLCAGGERDERMPIEAVPSPVHRACRLRCRRHRTRPCPQMPPADVAAPSHALLALSHRLEPAPEAPAWPHSAQYALWSELAPVVCEAGASLARARASSLTNAADLRNNRCPERPRSPSPSGMQPILVRRARTPARAASLLPCLSVALALVLLSLRLLRFIGDYTVNLFYWDQWSFYGGLFLERPLPDLFLWQHGIHRMGLGSVLLWLMAPFSRWDARYDAFLSGGTVILAAILALFLKFKLTNRLSWTDSIIPLIFLTLYQYDIFIGTANVSVQALPLLLVTSFCVALLIRPSVRRYAAIVVINFMSVFTGYALFQGFITPVVILIDIIKDPGSRRVKYAALLLSILTLVSFFAGYRLESTIDCFVFPGPPGTDYVGFVMLLYNSFFGLRGYQWFTPLFPAVLLIAYTSSLALIYSRKCVSRYMPAVVLFSFSFLFAINAAIGRVCAGVEAAYASRYVTFVIPAVFALYLTLLHARRWHAGTIMSVLLLGILGYCQIGDAQIVDTSRSHAHYMQQWRNCYLKSHDSDKCTRKIGQIYWVQDDLKQKLDYLESHRLNLFKDAPSSA